VDCIELAYGNVHWRSTVKGITFWLHEREVIKQVYGFYLLNKDLFRGSSSLLKLHVISFLLLS
jgi:hypothetical protein